MDSCVPGDVVTVSGVVKVNSTDEGQSFFKKDTTKEKILPMDILYLIYPKSLFFFCHYDGYCLQISNLFI